MGLDITAYRKLKVVKNPVLDEYGDPEEYDTQWKPGESMKWSEKHFEGRGQGINADTVYEFEEEDKYRFRAGSYISYNWWRSQLEKFKGNVAFQELIDFADNEGVIGPIVSTKLHSDFYDHLNEAEEYSNTLGEDGEWWLEKYKSWMKAFEYASDNGAVDFH